MTPPQLWAFAGPNGAGKSTFVVRFVKSLANLSVAIDLADRCFILDNTRRRHRLLMTIDNGQVRHLSRNLPSWARIAIPQAALRKL